VGGRLTGDAGKLSNIKKKERTNLRGGGDRKCRKTGEEW